MDSLWVLIDDVGKEEPREYQVGEKDGIEVTAVDLSYCCQASVLIKNSNDAVKLQALIDRKKVIITEDTIRQVLRLNDVDGIDCLPNEEIFVVLARMGYEKPSTKGLPGMNLVLPWPQLSSACHRIGKGFSGVETPLFDAMLVQQQVQDDVAEVEEDEDNEKVLNLEQDKIAQDLEITKLKQTVKKLENRRGFKSSGFKRLRKDTDEAEPAEVEEVLKVVTAAKLMTEVVTTAAPITTATQVPKASAPRRRRGVVIQDPKETAAASVIVHIKVKPKDKGKGILIEEPKPLKGKAKIKQDEAFARQLKAKLNADIEWNDVIKQVKRRERQNNEVMRYQDLKRKPLTEAQERKNIMIYLKNMAGFKMNFFKGMTYNEIRLLFEKHYNSNQAFLERVEEEVTVQEKEIKEEGNKRKGESLEQKIAKKQRMDEEEGELKRHKSRYGLTKVQSWKVFESYGVHIITLTTTQMFLMVEKKYPLTHFTLKQMLDNVRLEVEEESEMSLSC
uniref:Uncharacterized protein n=1 Tax=Tanacetum cinerariifolium TaxID=118510 RepID=A0A699I0P1_TANCI|nr:hypothetical protein [Tanacetum cinerariifolium]